ncbi:RHS repeat-associated protein [Haloferula luteola]|uniref:RHS repeat-associated protein n=1 Tax=Haloferula luteola TaxID=595692 RepID=A0A840V7R6_9BACT|nr:RHS repeat-associated protein [Haloferula luteola]
MIACTYHNSTSSLEHYIPSYDANGNILAWTDGSGTVVQRMDYDPFGNAVMVEKLAPASTPKLPSIGFSTKYQDEETGLYYYGYRYYDPVTGRWLSRDPIEEEGGVNLYGFVGNNGINQADFLGQYATIKEAGLAGAHAAAERSIRFDEIYNSDNWTYRYFGGGNEGIDFKLEYAGLVCCNSNPSSNEDKYQFTPPHEGVVFGPYPAVVKAKEPLIKPNIANYHPGIGAVLKVGGDSHAYSDPTYNFSIDQKVTCRKVFGAGWTMVGHYHSHPRSSGLEPSLFDKLNTLPGKRFLGAVAGDYSIHTRDY